MACSLCHAGVIRTKTVHEPDSKQGDLDLALPVLVWPTGLAHAMAVGLVHAPRLKASIVPGWHSSCIATALAGGQATFFNLDLL